MCGIAGIAGVNKISTGIEPVLKRIKHRGPDGFNCWQNDDYALGHARLSIIDLSDNASQPMIDPSTGNVLVFNGEIYNYLEIKKTLEHKYQFRSSSDSEVLLAAYACNGVHFLQQLRGMFAFAIFDKAENRILLARDRVGIKPLYYRFVNGAFIFASELKALINIDGQTENVNELKAYEFIANRQLDCDEQTMFKNIFQLLPAHYTWVSADGKMEEPKQYWDFPEPGTRRFYKESQEELAEVMDNTIQLHLRSDVEVGSFVSGGLDSSSVACFALKNLAQPHLHTFSAILPYHHPENALIGDIINKDSRIIPHNFLLSGEKFFDDIPSVIYHHDEPVMDGSMYAHYKLCELAKQNHVKVLLSGSGGDELFGGYNSHIHAHHARLLSKFRIAKYFSDVKQVTKYSSLQYKNLIAKSLYALVPSGIKRSLKNRQLRSRNEHLQVHPGVKHFYFQHHDHYFSNLINNYKSWTVPPYLHYEDRNSMAFGVEVRVPFLDHELISFVLQFVPEDIISGSSKSMMRKSFRGVVPDTILDQKGKYGFPSPIDHALQESKEGREIFFDLYKSTPLIETKATEKLADDFYNGNGNLTTYWRTLSFIIWYHLFFKKWKGYVN